MVLLNGFHFYSNSSFNYQYFKDFEKQIVELQCNCSVDSISRQVRTDTVLVSSSHES